MLRVTLPTALLLALAWLAPTRAAAAPPITLDEALAAAARANLDLRLAQTDREGADVDEYASWAGVLPRLDLAAGFGNNYTAAGQQLTITPVSLNPLQYEQIIVTTPTSDFESYTLALQLTVPLFDGFKSWANISRSKALARAANKTVDESRLAVSFEVTRRFYDLVRAERSLKVLEESAARSEELVRRTDALYEAGRAPRADTYAARVTLGNDRIAAEQQRARVEDARVFLCVALGRDADPGLEVAPPAALDQVVLLQPPEQAELVELARKSRPVLAARAEQVEASEQEVRSAASGYWPAISAQATYGRQSPWLAGTYGVYGDPSLQFGVQVGINVTWNLFEGRATSARVQQANVSEQRARLKAEQALQQVTGEIARSRASYVTLSRSAVMAAENLRSAEESLRLAATRFEAGAATQLEIRDAMLKLTQAQLALLQARIDAIIARADLNRSVGGAL
jgi:outer membrane protein TolC